MTLPETPLAGQRVNTLFMTLLLLPLNSNGTKIQISLKEEKPLRLRLALMKKLRKHPPLR